jgi:hypothetical protein
VTTGTILLVVTYAVCLHDVFSTFPVFRALVDQTSSDGGEAPASRARKFASGQWAQALGLVGLLGLFTNSWCKLPELRRHYASLTPLDLPGSHLVRFDSETSEMYRALAQYLQAECDTFVTYPGINSLYFWTNKHPPTHLNSTGWGPLSHSQQEQILIALRQSKRPMLVVVAAAAQTWTSYAPPQLSPLIQFVSKECREVTRIGRFILFVPKAEQKSRK